MTPELPVGNGQGSSTLNPKPFVEEKKKKRSLAFSLSSLSK
jgi:hypothetical protein